MVPLIFLSFVLVVKAQVPSLGFCPEYLPVADFDMERFLGKWYEAERYFQFTEVATRCVVTDYAKAPSGRIYVSNEVTNRLTGIKRVIDGFVEFPNNRNEGKLTVRYSTSPIATESQLTVLDTDYDNYAVVWSCSGFGPIHTQSVWLMTRERIAAGPVMQEAYGVLDKYKISRNFFIKTDQAGCAIAASDINAANGITSISTLEEAIGLPQRKVPLQDTLSETATGERNVISGEEAEKDQEVTTSSDEQKSEKIETNQKPDENNQESVVPKQPTNTIAE